MTQELRSAIYMQQKAEELAQLEQPEVAEVRNVPPVEKLNKLLMLTLVPFALIMGAIWTCQGANNYVETEKNKLRRKIGRQVARARKNSQRGLAENQAAIETASKRFNDISRRIHGR